MDRKLGGLIAVVIGLAGCAAQPELMKQTQSGRPEAVFHGATSAEIRNELATRCAKSGSNTSSTEYTVTCSRKNDSMRGMMAEALLGNACSNTPVERIEFSINQAGQDVFVTARGMMQIEKCFGQIETIDYNNNNFRNSVQQGLDAAVQRWDAMRGTAQVEQPQQQVMPQGRQVPANAQQSQNYEMDPAKRCDACARIHP
jgi:hypothetical protein